MQIRRCSRAPIALVCVLFIAIGVCLSAQSTSSAPSVQEGTAAQIAAPTPSSAPFASQESAREQPFRAYLPLVAVPPWLNTPFPPAAANGRSPNTYLSWRADPMLVSPVRFDVYLEADDSTPDVVIAQNLAKPAVDPPTLALATTYYWQVVAKDRKGLAYAGPVWSFATEALTDPPDLEAMVYVPEGEFLMGCDRSNPDERCRDDYFHREEPLHRVYLDAYWIDKYEVTNREYRACVAARACQGPREMGSWTRDSYYDNTAFDYYPVLFVSWWDGQAYCGWKGGRLPTEAEWEKAARGPIDTRAWPWGNELPDCQRENTTLDFNESDMTACVGDTARVGSYPSGASPYGALDMSGNVFEWVKDLYSLTYYAWSPYRNPQGPSLPNDPEDGDYVFTIRGGSYRQHWFYTRAAHRHWGHHGDYFYYRNDQVGFRCARPATD